MSNDNFRNRLKYDNNDKQIMHEKLMSLLNEYEKNNSYENREFLCYLTSAIFLTYKKLYPQLSIYIPFRTKSDMSFIKNIQKEFSDTSKEDLLDTFSISKDISGIRIILDNINYAIPPKGESASLFNDSEVRELLELSHNNFHFVEQVNHYIQSPIKNGKQYIELKKQLLEKIISITPSEFTEERKPRASFSKLLEDAKEQYNYFLENDSFPTLVSENEITELSTLLTEFRSRIDDPLHFAILRKTLPVVFEHPLIKNVLKTSSKFSKESKKANGFQSIYYTLNTPFGFIEVQSQ